MFDAYGVCLSRGYPDTSEALGKMFKMDPKKIQSVLYGKYFNMAALKKITQKQAWDLAVKELGLPIGGLEAKKLHYGLMELNSRVLSLALELKKIFRIALLSKNTRSQFHDLQQMFPRLGNIFGKDMINTWEYNLPKASRQTIKFICREYKVKPQEILYFDDQKDNLKEPEKMGVATIHYRNFNQFKKELEKHLR